jgi:hypothetical protein
MNGKDGKQGGARPGMATGIGVLKLAPLTCPFREVFVGPPARLGDAEVPRKRVDTECDAVGREFRHRRRLVSARRPRRSGWFAAAQPPARRFD